MEGEVTSQARVVNDKPAFTAVNSYLVTPPEETLHSFSSATADDAKRAPETWDNKLPPLQSPPTTPATKLLPSLAAAVSLQMRDPPLYPDEQTLSQSTQTPLFAQEAPQPAATTPQQTPELAKQLPSHSKTFPAILCIRTPDQALEYYYDRLRELQNYPGAGKKLPTPHQTANASSRHSFDKDQLNKISRPAGVTKSKHVPKPTSKAKALVPASPSRPLPPRKRTPKARTAYGDFMQSAFPSASQPAKHKRAPPSKKIEDNNVSWTDLPDYAPPTTALEASGKVLKANWNGSSLDLANDPNRSHLHPQEIHIASTLRLTGQQYLFNKRKIFQARLQALKDGRNFTKTAAQGACSIDVNKASQLWEAFDRVGWFKETWFDQFM